MCAGVCKKSQLSKSLAWFNYYSTVIQGSFQFSMKDIHTLCLSLLTQYPVAMLGCLSRQGERKMKAEELGERPAKELCFPLLKLGMVLIP